MQIPVGSFSKLYVNEQCDEPDAVSFSEDTARLVVLYETFQLFTVAGNSVRDWHPPW
jgi:hypothetical protein